MKKIAIVYDWMDKWGGVERVLLTLHQMFPDADFYTSSYDPEKASWAKDINIKTSFIQKLPSFIKGSRVISLPFYSFAFESFNFNQYDIVISVTSSFAKAVITKAGTYHICILLTPNRFLWILPNDYLSQGFKILFFKTYLNYLKKYDQIIANRPDRIISISNTVKDRCLKYYKRESEVIYPPFDIQYWDDVKYQISNIKNSYQISKITKQYFLVVSRLEKYKKVDLVIETFNQLPSKQLIIVGIGSEINKLKKFAKNNITFLGKVTDLELAKLYSNAQALIMPQEEDFGYVSLEAQFFGCPVISYSKGGAKETVIEHKTGIFFDHQTSNGLKSALEQFETISYNLKDGTRRLGLKNAKRFEKQIFINKFLKVIDFRG